MENGGARQSSPRVLTLLCPAPFAPLAPGGPGPPWPYLHPAPTGKAHFPGGNGDTGGSATNHRCAVLKIRAKPNIDADTPSAKPPPFFTPKVTKIQAALLKPMFSADFFPACCSPVGRSPGCNTAAAYLPRAAWHKRNKGFRSIKERLRQLQSKPPRAAGINYPPRRVLKR